MLKAYERGSLMGCSLEPDPNEVEARCTNGLVRGHAYSLTRIQTSYNSLSLFLEFPLLLFILLFNSLSCLFSCLFSSLILLSSPPARPQRSGGPLHQRPRARPRLLPHPHPDLLEFPLTLLRIPSPPVYSPL
ncbi:uncharacterized protein LOC119571199 [Penaeus monodon]|uniref:uncharacterized protein LOC119571199 n=1 Tax=Penaeus monodon TaxID=6687 RepID=UPI0018A743C8|nr:uncharacterized protein LOC119571199 [Penaeus monodon]